MENLIVYGNVVLLGGLVVAQGGLPAALFGAGFVALVLWALWLATWAD